MGSLSCSAGHDSRLTGSSGVIISVTGTSAAPKNTTIAADARVFESSTDFNPSASGPITTDTNVIAAGPAKRAKTKSKHPNTSCTSKRGKHSKHKKKGKAPCSVKKHGSHHRKHGR
jgi:hypothetical protein